MIRLMEFLFLAATGLMVGWFIVLSIQHGEENYCKNMEGKDPTVGIYYGSIDCPKN